LCTEHNQPICSDCALCRVNAGEFVAGDSRNDLLDAVTLTLTEAKAAERYTANAHRDALATVARAQDAYDLACKLIRDGKVSP
jgi:hypothetical protein